MCTHLSCYQTCVCTRLLCYQTRIQICNYWHKPSLHHKTSNILRSLHTQKNHTSRHYHHWSNQPIMKIVISDLLDLIHHQVPRCILSSRSNKSIITHYMYTCFRSKYAWNIHHLHTSNTLIFISLYSLALRQYHRSKPY